LLFNGSQSAGADFIASDGIAVNLATAKSEGCMVTEGELDPPRTFIRMMFIAGEPIVRHGQCGGRDGDV
jgi:hypothetical protein